MSLLNDQQEERTTKGIKEITRSPNTYWIFKTYHQENRKLECTEPQWKKSSSSNDSQRFTIDSCNNYANASNSPKFQNEWKTTLTQEDTQKGIATERSWGKHDHTDKRRNLPKEQETDWKGTKDNHDLLYLNQRKVIETRRKNLNMA